MSAKYIAVDELTLDCSDGDVSINGSTASETVLIDNHGVYFGELKIKVENSSGGGTIGDGNGTGTASIKGTGSNFCDKDSSGNLLNALLEGDSVTVTVNGTTTPESGGTPAPSSGTATVKISKAGQDSVTTS